LLSHLDVVPADPAEWAVAPFSGVRREDFVYGRGTLDSKGIGIAHLMALVLLQRYGVALDHDIVFLATADEETGGALGAGWVVRQRPDWLRGVTMVLTEGDHIHTESERPLVQVAVAEKSPCWLRLTARGPAGHGSTPPTETAVTRLVAALDRIRAHESPPRVVPAVSAYFSAVAALRDEPHRSQLQDLEAALADSAYRAEFEADPWQYALVHNTITPTVLEGSRTTNVIPSKAHAELDCRLLPGEDVDSFVAALRRVIDDPGIEMTRILAFPSPASPAESPLMTAIRAVAARELDDPLVVPSVIAGFTDSHYFRGLGIVSYGFAPFAQPPEERRRIHGNDERVSIQALRDAIRFMFHILLEIG
jgi:acetylornithine deacetylase/succinyl-diaminopimelate desuccinylase-like protein